MHYSDKLLRSANRVVLVGGLATVTGFCAFGFVAFKTLHVSTILLSLILISTASSISLTIKMGRARIRLGRHLKRIKTIYPDLDWQWFEEMIEEEVRQSATLKDFRFGELFGLLLPRKVREEVFVPSFDELKEDYLVGCRAKSATGKMWLRTKFRVRMCGMVLGCWRVVVLAGVGGIVRWTVLKSVQRFFFR